MKPVTISFKTSDEIKAVLEKQAKEGYRSISQQVEMIVIERLKAEGYLDEEGKPLSERNTKQK